MNNVTTLKTKHDPSFVTGWNDLAMASEDARIPEFDPDKYLGGIIAAAEELRRKKEEMAAVWVAHQAEMDAVLTAIDKLEKAGICLARSHDSGFYFCQPQGINKLLQPFNYDSDVPF